MPVVALRRSCRRKIAASSTMPDAVSSTATSDALSVSKSTAISAQTADSIGGAVTISSLSSETFSRAVSPQRQKKRLKVEGEVIGHSSSELKCAEARPDSVPSSAFSANDEDKTALLAVKSSVTIETTKILRPTAAECTYVSESLELLHPDAVRAHRESRKKAAGDRGDDLQGSCGYRREVLDGVVATMLSQNTTDANSRKAFANLKAAFPSWDAIVKLESTAPIAKAIHVAGLSETRSQRIYDMCKTLEKERGLPVSMDYLRDMCDNEQIKKELSRFKGLGPKTISCVLLFTLHRDDFPVDTHVWRIAQSRLGWVPGSFSREDTYQYLNEVIPGEHKLPLHCLLVTHGKHCHACAARGRPQFPPKDGSKLKCPLGKDALRVVYEQGLLEQASKIFATSKAETGIPKPKTEPE